MESLTRPFVHHRRKLSNVSSNNGLSFSGKDAYDDVFAGGTKHKVGGAAAAATTRKVAAGEYAEIFGGGNGTRCSSIPVLELPDLDERNGLSDFRSSDNNKLDYSTIFGGFGVGGGGDEDLAASAMALPPSYEDLFNGVKKGKTHKAKARMSADIGSPLQGSEHFNPSDNNKSRSSEASDQIVDDGKQFNMSYHKTGQRRKDGSNGTTHIAELHVVPGFTYVIDETARQQKTQQDKLKLPVKAEVNHSRSANGHLPKTELSKAKPPGKADVNYNRSSSDCLQQTERDTTMPPVSLEVNHDRSSNGHSPKTELGKAKPPGKAEVNHNRSSSVCLQQTERDKTMPPVSLEVNHDRSSSDDISEGKYGKRAKWQLPTPQAPEILVQDRGECNQHESNSWDKTFDELDLLSGPSEVSTTSSSSAHLNDSKGHSERLESSNYGPKIEASEKIAGGYSTSFSDDELDVNSAAAASAAALRKAIEQAQESIRIAKEIMEKRRYSVQSSKSCSKGSLKSEDRREIRQVEKAKDIGENNVKEVCENVDNKVQDSIGVDKKIGRTSCEVASSFNYTEKPSTQGAVTMSAENVKVAEENGVATWFTQLLNNGKHRMAALASELVGKTNSISQPLNKDVHEIQETKPAKLTTERDSTEKVNGVDSILEFGDTESKVNALGRPEEFEKNVDNSDSSMFAHEDRVSETLTFVQEDEVTNNIQNSFTRGEKCKEKLDDCCVEISDRQFELEQLENALSEDESPNQEPKVLDQEVEKKLDDIYVWKENHCRMDEEEIDKLEEFHPWVGNEEETKMATGYVSSGTGQEYDPLERYHTQEIDEQRSTPTVDEEGNQITSEEQHVWEVVERRPTWTFQNDEADNSDEYADSCSANQKMEVNEEVQEIGDIHAGTEGTAESPRENLFQETVYEQRLNTANDAHNIGQSDNLCDTQDACRCEVENIREQKSELETRDHEGHDNVEGFTDQTIQQECSNYAEKANKVGVSECLYEFEGDANAPEPFEETSRLKGKQILETSSMDHDDAQDNIVEGIIQDAFKAVASDVKTVDFGFVKINHEAEPSNETEMVRSFICKVAEDDATNNEDAMEVPPAVQNSSNVDFTDMNEQQQMHENVGESEFSINTENSNESIHENYGQKQIEESNREPEFGIHPENGDSLFHESTGNAENVKVDDIASEEKIGKDDIEMGHEESGSIENEKELESSQLPRELERDEHVETNTNMETGHSKENNEENVSKYAVKEHKETRENVQKEEVGKDCFERTEVNRREREREKDRVAVERAIREARGRAFAEARERVERAAVEKATAEVRQRAMTEAREKLEKMSAGTKMGTNKASFEAKLRAERAAVERATAEARERALEKALSQKSVSETRAQADRNFSGASRKDGLKHSFSSSDLERFDGTNNESAQRRKARLERHQRIMERAAKALAEKNLRDVLAQREQAERNRLAETLDADVKRWASGKEGNLRALLSTLQYILGPGSGWQPISLTEIITSSAVKKAYRKATLYVHPDKLQQRGASIQQKYICEKVFDLLKAGWTKFNSEER